MNYYLEKKNFFIIGKTNILGAKKVPKTVTFSRNSTLKSLITKYQTAFFVKTFNDKQDLKKEIILAQRRKDYSLIIKSANLYFFSFKDSIYKYKLESQQLAKQLYFLLSQHLLLFKIKNINKQVKILIKLS